MCHGSESVDSVRGPLNLFCCILSETFIFAFCRGIIVLRLFVLICGARNSVEKI